VWRRRAETRTCWEKTGSIRIIRGMLYIYIDLYIYDTFGYIGTYVEYIKLVSLSLSLSLCLSIAYLGRSANSFEYNMGLDIFGISMGICFGSINDIFNKRTCPIGSETLRTW